MNTTSQPIEVLIVSGRSGAGKSSALHMLEDMGYYCIDNLPLSLMADVVQQAATRQMTDKLALGVDIRTWQTQDGQVADTIAHLATLAKVQVIFLTAQDPTLLTRYASTRRVHPLMQQAGSLLQALQMESMRLAPFAKAATILIDTTSTNIHQLQSVLSQRLLHADSAIVVLQSFGFKYGVPLDADMVFDARHLPNPFWDDQLKNSTGIQLNVQQFLDAQPEFVAFYQDVAAFLLAWLPRYVANNRQVITIAIGCTGGKHRSVYLVEKLLHHFQQHLSQFQLQVVHRQQADW